MFLKKIWYKITDKKRYQELKFIENSKKAKIPLDINHEKQINLIQHKIENQDKLNFLHSGHAADIVNVLPVIKELSKNHECNLFINLDKPIKFYFKHPAGSIYLNEKIYTKLTPLLENQKYINKVEKFIDQEIDVNLDLFRDLPINLTFDNIRYASIVTGVQPDYNSPFLEVDDHSTLKNKVIIQRTFRYRNNFINYEFLNNYENLCFVGTKDEYEDLKSIVKNLEFYDCKDFLDMAKAVKSSKFVLANSSLTFPIAEGLNVPRLLEACPEFPAAQPHGKNSFTFYFQSHFEKFFDYLYKLNNN